MFLFNFPGVTSCPVCVAHFEYLFYIDFVLSIDDFIYFDQVTP